MLHIKKKLGGGGRGGTGGVGEKGWGVGARKRWEGVHSQSLDPTLSIHK